ncbi:MAG TPA: YdeI/OmpD-associated family protein [Actinocrinis sp.]|nr:YdeI/OmpD-associated family protein [Actinocrinis sp.]
MKITATVQLNGKTATGVVIPEDIVEALGGGQRPKVQVTIGDYTYRNSVAPMNGGHMLSLSSEVRQATGVKAGDTIELDLQLDTAPREIGVPDDLAAALAESPQAKAFFGQLSYSNQRVHTESVTGAKTAETRQRRIQKAVALLAEGKVR